MTRQHILEIATDEFSRLGYNGVSMNHLAAKLKVNKATIYYHYADKQTLYQEVLSNLLELTAKEHQHVWDNALSSRDKLKHYIMQYISNIAAKPQIVPLALREMVNLGSGLSTDNMVDYVNEDIERIRRIVQTLELKPRYQTLDGFELKALIIGTIHTYYVMHQSPLPLQGVHTFENTSQSLEYIGHFVSDVLLDALCQQ